MSKASPDLKTNSDVKHEHETELTGSALGLTPEMYAKYKMAEYLAHTLAYDKKLKTNMVIPVLVPNPTHVATSHSGTANCHLKEELHSVFRLTTSHAGLVAYLLFPNDFTKQNGNKIDLKIIFRGTEITEWSSVKRDVVEEGGAGHQSYGINKKAILKQINAGIQHLLDTLTKRGVNCHLLELSLSIAGHSLGGADAQRCYLSIIEAIAQNQGISIDVVRNSDGVEAQHRAHFNRIRKLSLHTFNTTGITRDDNHKAEQIAAFLANRTISKSHVDLEVNIFYAEGDGVQQTGETHLLHRVPANIATVNLVLAMNKYNGSHFITKAEFQDGAAKFVGKQIGFKGLEYVCMGAAAGITLYTCGVGAALASITKFGLSPTTWSGTVAAAAAAIYKVSDWYETGRILYSIGYGGWGTIRSHTNFYFTDHYTQLNTKKEVNLFFLSFSNKNAAEQKSIMEQVGKKCGLTNTLHTTYSKTRRNVCETFFAQKPEKEHDITIQSLAWQYNPNAVNLLQFQQESLYQQQQAAKAASFVNNLPIAKAQLTNLMNRYKF